MVYEVREAARKRGRPKGGEAPTPKELTRLEKQKTMSLDDMMTDLLKAFLIKIFSGGAVYEV